MGIWTIYTKVKSNGHFSTFIVRVFRYYCNFTLLVNRETILNLDALCRYFWDI